MTTIPTREHAPRISALTRRPVSPQAPAGATGLTAREILRVIRKRLLLILLTFAVTFGVVLVVTLLWWLYYPWYTVAALVAVGPPPTRVLDPTNPMYSREIMERYKRTQAELAKQLPVLTKVAGDTRVTNTSWFASHRDKVLQELDGQIKVSPMPDTDLIRLSMTGTQKDELADIVNTLADAFVSFANDRKRAERNPQIVQLKTERDNLRNELNSIGRQIAIARANSPMAGMEVRRSTLTIKLQMLTQDIGEAEVQQGEAQAALDALKKETPESLANSMEVAQIMNMDRSLAALSVQLLQARTSLDALRQRFPEQHRTVQISQSVVAALQQQEESTRREVLQRATEQLVQFRQVALAAATQRLADLTKRFNDAQNTAGDLEDAVERIDRLARQSTYTEENFRRVQQRLLELELLGARTPGGSEEGTWADPTSVYVRASNPRQPSEPKWLVMVLLGAALGLLLGFGLAFLVEMADTSVKAPADLVRRVDLPLLGMVPHSDDLDEEIEDFRRVTLLAPHSPAAEAFRHIRTNLLFSGPAQERRSLVVTSPAPEDGRTTVVLNLAVSMAQAGRRVLIVDANFRQPAIASLFPQAAAAGLSSCLVGQANWREVVSATGVPNLSVVNSGPLPPNPAELLSSDTMRQLVSEMTAEYDQVIFDASPVMVVADAAVLSTQVDATILVVRAGQNSVGIVQRAADQLHRVGARIVGVVLQGVRTTAGGYLRKNYETFYEYQQKPPLP